MATRRTAPALRRLVDGDRLGVSALVVVLLAAVIFAIDVALQNSDTINAQISRDPAAVAGVPHYTGWLSTLGVLLWMGGAVAALISARVVDGRQRSLLTWFGTFTLVLVVDDAMMIHEGLAVDLVGDLGELALFGAYALAAVWTVVAHRDVLVGPGALLVAVGVFGLAASMFVDVTGVANDYIEDSFKFVGVGSWATGLLLRSLAAIDRRASLDGGRREEREPVIDLRTAPSAYEPVEVNGPRLR